jgi:hypothetical protein
MGVSPKARVWATLWLQHADSCDVIAHHQALTCLIRAIKRVKRRRISLRERETSRLRLKPKLGYKLPAEAYLYKYR